MELRLPIGLQPVEVYTNASAHCASAIIKLENASKQFKELIKRYFPNMPLDNRTTLCCVKTHNKQTEYYYYTLWDDTVSIGIGIHFLKPENERTGIRVEPEKVVSSIILQQHEAEGIDRLVSSLRSEETPDHERAEEEYQRYEAAILEEQTKPRPLD